MYMADMKKCSRCCCLKNPDDYVIDNKSTKTCGKCILSKRAVRAEQADKNIWNKKDMVVNGDTSDFDNYLMDEDYLEKALPNHTKSNESPCFIY
jgi:hypothetical protein